MFKFGFSFIFIRIMIVVGIDKFSISSVEYSRSFVGFFFTLKVRNGYFCLVFGIGYFGFWGFRFFGGLGAFCIEFGAGRFIGKGFLLVWSEVVYGVFVYSEWFSFSFVIIIICKGGGKLKFSRVFEEIGLVSSFCYTDF